MSEPTRPQPSAEPVGDLIERAKARAMTLRWHEPIPVRVFVRDGCVIWSKVDDNNCNLTVENSEGMLYHAHSLFVPHTETPLYPASALEAARREALEQAIERMGWPEIHAFQDVLRNGQGVQEDAGGFMLRAIKALFGLKPDTVETYRDAMRAMLKENPNG